MSLVFIGPTAIVILLFTGAYSTVMITRTHRQTVVRIFIALTEDRETTKRGHILVFSLSLELKVSIGASALGSFDPYTK